MNKPIKKGIYRHFKGEFYTVIEEGFDSETEIPVVIYQHNDTKKIWVRPKHIFSDIIDHDGKKQIRFTFIR